MASSGRGPLQRKWAVDFAEAHPSSARDVQDPLGFSRQADAEETSSKAVRVKEVDANWKQQKAWEAAQAPAKNILMMAFMLWMAGSTVHIFSIGIVFSALWQPISAFQQVNKMFEPFKDAKTDTLLPKALFMAINLAAFILGLWKLNALGLLPTHPSDWLSQLPPRQVLEISGGGVAF